MKTNSLTYTGFLELFSETDKKRMDIDFIALKERFNAGETFMLKLMPVLFIVDYASKKYIYIDDLCENIVGLPSNYFYQKGVKGFWDYTEQSDFSIINEMIFPHNLKFITTVGVNNYFNYIFSLNFRFSKPDGTVIQLLQRSSFIGSSNSDIPAGVIGFVYDITHFKTDNSIVHTIEKIEESNNNDAKQLILRNVYMPEKQTDLILSERELQILRLLKSGEASKQIADQLGISVHTVNNHRKNMLKKTGCPNASSLFSFAYKKGWI